MKYIKTLFILVCLSFLTISCGGGGSSSGGGDNPAFTTADLGGTWYFNGVRSAGSEGTNSGTIVIDSSGNVTGGSFTRNPGVAKTITGGSLAISAAGVVSGTIIDSSPITSTIRGGKMDASKTVLSFVDDSTNSEIALNVMIKQ